MTKEELLLLLETNGLMLKVYPEFSDDEEVASKAISQQGMALKYTGERIKNNKKIVLEAVAKTGWALQFASKDLCNDKDVVLTAITQCGTAIKFANKRFKNNERFARIAVTQNSWAVDYISERLKANRDLILLASMQDGYALGFVNYKYQDDEEIVLQGLKNYDDEKLEFVSIRLQNKIKNYTKKFKFDSYSKTAEFLLNKLKSEQEAKNMNENVKDIVKKVKKNTL